MKKSLFLALFLEFAIITIIFTILEKTDEISTVKRELGIFYSEFPTSTPRFVREKDWVGYAFKEGLSIYYMKAEDPPHVLGELLQNYILGEKPTAYHFLPLGDVGTIALYKKKNGYRLVSLSRVDTIIVWADLDANTPFLGRKFEFFQSFLANLKVNSVPVTGPLFPGQFKEFYEKIPVFSVPRKGLFYGFFAVLILISNGIAVILTLIGGQMPKEIDPEWELITPHVWVYEKQPIGYRSYSACLVKKGDEIIFLVFGKVHKTLKLDSQTANIRFFNKTIYFGDKIKVELPSQEDLIRWQSSF